MKYADYRAVELLNQEQAMDAAMRSRGLRYADRRTIAFVREDMRSRMTMEEKRQVACVSLFYDNLLSYLDS